MLRTIVAVSLIAAGYALVAAEPEASSGSRDKKSIHRLASKHLPNLVQVHPKVISGGLPEGEKAFQELRSLGVKTIISVDGQKPDVKTATRFGLRYVHLPHGYDGVPEVRVKELAKAVRVLDGPIYIHCHHGKHRSPAAASVACVAAGLIPKTDSMAILTLAGTSPHYRGLYQSAQEAKPLEEALLDELEVAFPETAQVPPLAEAMVAMERTHDHLKRIAAAGWQTPDDHPDLDPAHEALLMREYFTELLRKEETGREPAKYRKFLRDSETAARRLEDSLRQWEPQANQSTPPAAIPRHYAQITDNCKTCHEQFRDVPLSEK